MRRPALISTLGLLIVGGFVGSACVSTVQVRVENVSALSVTDLWIAGHPFGDLPVGATSEYHPVRLRGRYAALEFWADGYKVTGQTLNVGAARFRYRLDVLDPAKGRLHIEVVRE